MTYDGDTRDAASPFIPRCSFVSGDDGGIGFVRTELLELCIEQAGGDTLVPFTQRLSLLKVCTFFLHPKSTLATQARDDRGSSVTSGLPFFTQSLWAFFNT